MLDIGCSETPNIVRLSVVEDPAARNSISSHPRMRFDYAQRDRGRIDEEDYADSKDC